MKLSIQKNLLFGVCILLLCGGSTYSHDDKDPNVRCDIKTPGASATLVLPIARDGAYVLEITDGTDAILFECTAEEGGLITKFMLNGKHLVSQLEASNTYGSTFWPSPQIWKWPPSRSMPSLAGDSYTATIETNCHAIVLESNDEPGMGLKFIKRFSPDLVNRAIDIQYTIRNTSDNVVSVAPWEVTRVAPGGLTFFPTGDEVYKNNLEITEAIGMTWVQQPTEGAAGHSKLYADGKDGWVAHAASGMLFVKTFTDQPMSARAPDQGEIEIYTNGSIYQEIEQQGAYESLPAGGEINWNLKWFLRPLPADVEAVVGNPSLVDLAASLASP